MLFVRLVVSNCAMSEQGVLCEHSGCQESIADENAKR